MAAEEANDMPSDMFNIQRRVCVHFAGFEPLSVKVHRARYMRAARQSADTYDFKVKFSALDSAAQAPSFHVYAEGAGWKTDTKIFFFEHLPTIEFLGKDTFFHRLVSGFQAAGTIFLQGGLARFAKTAWRFALFFLFPYIFLSVSVLLLATTAALPLIAGISPLHLLWSLPAAFLLYRMGLKPLAEKYHLQLLLDGSRMVVLLAKPDSPVIQAGIAKHSEALALALREDADEFLITSHSLGCIFAYFAMGRLLQKDPNCFAGRGVTLVTIAGNGMLTSLLDNARELRQCVQSILACPDIKWLDVQGLSDPAQLHASNVVHGHTPFDKTFSGLTEPFIKHFRIRRMLKMEDYKRMKWDVLQKHRQFILGSQMPSDFDFAVLTAGPHSAFSMRLVDPEQHLNLKKADSADI